MPLMIIVRANSTSPSSTRADRAESVQRRRRATYCQTFFDGVAIAAGFLVSTWLGAVIFFAVFLHKLPEGFTVASVVLASGQGKRRAVQAAGLLGAATLAGVLLTSQLQGQLKYALPLSGGVTLYVAATDLLPEVNREPNWRMALLVFVGVATLLILKVLFHA